LDLANLIPSFGNTLFTIGAFIIALSVIVAIHEYGHYIVGRWCGIKAEVFSLGFGPVLFARTDKHGTVWQVAALPFGGYVKFLGDANAASASDDGTLDEMDATTRRATMHGAPLWARSATVAAGPIFNFILSIIVFGLFIMSRGITADPLTVSELRPMPEAEIGLQAGDQLLEVSGIEVPYVENLGDFIEELPREALLEYRVLRDGREITVEARHPYPPYVTSLTPGGAALDAGLEPGDVITNINGASIGHFYDLLETVEGSEGKPLVTQVWRPGAGGEGEMLEFTLVPRLTDLPNAQADFSTNYKIGVGAGLLFAPATETPGFGRAVTYGVEQTWYIAKTSVSGLYHMAAQEISRCNMRGFVGIAQTSGDAAAQGLASFIWFIAVLSTAVGLLNLFPIPVLDGGHLVFHAYEAVTGRPPSEGALRVLMAVGLTLILGLMAFALTNDFTCP
jgi:regulator of sigma E protease